MHVARNEGQEEGRARYLKRGSAGLEKETQEVRRGRREGSKKGERGAQHKEHL